MFTSALLRTATGRSRSLHKKMAATAFFSTPAAASATATTTPPAPPSAFDVVVQLTFVDPNGARRQVPGYVGTYHTVQYSTYSTTASPQTTHTQ